METELFGTRGYHYIYEDKDWRLKTLKLVDSTSEYALTGAVLSGWSIMLLRRPRKLYRTVQETFYNQCKTHCVPLGQNKPFWWSKGIRHIYDKAGFRPKPICVAYPQGWLKKPLYPVRLQIPVFAANRSQFLNYKARICDLQKYGLSFYNPF